MTYLTALLVMTIMGHIDPFSLLGIAHLFGPKKYSKPQALFSLTNHFHCKCGWKFPCDSMAWRLFLMLTEYMCMTHPISFPYMEEIDHLEGQGWTPHHLACPSLSLILV